MNDSSPWRVVFHRVSSPDRQQRVLAAIVHVDRPGLRAIGTGDGDDRVVAVECRTVGDEMAATRIVAAVDPAARLAARRSRAGGRVLALRAHQPADGA